MKKIAILTAIIAVLSVSGYSFENEMLLNDPESPLQVSLNAESGFVKVLKHTLQFGTNGTLFDYVSEGGQSILFPFNRFTAELTINQRHSIIFLYQPLNILTEVTATRDLVFETITFTNGSYLNLRYGFPFYRISYLYHIIENDHMELSAGLSFQLRNATITFASKDGELFYDNRNLGPVPILKVRFKYLFNSGLYLGAEVDAFYASSKFFNGSDIDFMGSIWDANIRAGYRMSEFMDLYFNLRFLGGGAEGTSSADRRPGESGYTFNDLNTFSLTLGTVLR